MVDVLFLAGNARSLIANRGDLIRDLQKAGLQIAAVIPTADYLPEVNELGIDVFPIEMNRTGTNPFYDLKYLVILRLLINRINPRMVFAYTIKQVVYGSLAARSVGVIEIYSMITGLGYVYSAKNSLNIILQYFTSLLYRVAISVNRKVFFQNPDDLQEFLNRGIMRDRIKAVRTYGSGVNMERFQRTPLPHGRHTFLTVCRLLKEKGVAEFCEAARLIKEDFPDVRFVVVGPHDPTLPHSISTMDIERWRREGFVELIGGVKDVRPWISECSVFVLTSYYREGTPRSVLEAMSMGRPIITSDSPGCRETVVDGQNGFLVTPRQVDQLTLAMRRFLENPQLISKMGDASWKMVEQYYDVHKVNRVIMEAMGLSALQAKKGISGEKTL